MTLFDACLFRARLRPAVPMHRQGGARRQKMQHILGSKLCISEGFNEQGSELTHIRSVVSG